MINLEFACYLIFVCVCWVFFFSCCSARKEAKVHVCCSVSFILPLVQAIPWWQPTEVPQDAGPQFNFHFTVSAYGVDGGRRKMMLHLRPNHAVSFPLQKWGLQHFLVVHGVGSLSCQIPGSAWLAPVTAWQMWHEEHGLYRGSCHLPEFICSPRAVAAGLSRRAAASTRRGAGGGGGIQSSASEAAARFIWCCCSLNPWLLGGRGRGKDCI